MSSMPVKGIEISQQEIERRVEKSSYLSSSIFLVAE